MKKGGAACLSHPPLVAATAFLLVLLSFPGSAHVPELPEIYKPLLDEVERSSESKKPASLLKLFRRLSLDHPAELLHIYDDHRELFGDAASPTRNAIEYFVCLSYHSTGQHERARISCDALAEQSKIAGDDVHESLAYSVLGMVEGAQSKDENAVRLYLAALRLSDDPYPQAIAHFNLARSYCRQGVPELGFDHLQKVIGLVGDPGMDQTARDLYSSYAYEELGDSNELFGKLDQAKANFEHALEDAKKSGSSRMQIGVLRKLTGLQLKLGDTEGADESSQAMLELAATTRFSSSIAASNSGRAVVLLAKGRPREALAFAQKAHQASASSKAWVQMRTGLVLARVFSALGDHRAALNLINEVERNVRNAQRLGSVVDVLKVKSDLEAAAGNASASLAATSESVAAQQAAASLGANRRMEYMQLELDQRRYIANAQKAELEQRIAKAELEQRIVQDQLSHAAWVRNVSLVIGLGLLVLGYLALNWLHQSRAQKILQIQLAQRSAELDAEAQKRIELEAELRQSQKLEAIGQLTGGVAHDFNNLMTVVISSSELLEASDNSTLSQSERSLITNVKQAARTASSITAQLLAFARTQSLNPKPVNLVQAVNSIESLLKRSIGECLKLEICSERDDIWCNIDSAQLNSALLNLVLNARDASPRTGSIRIDVRVEKQLPKDLSAVHSEYACIAVSDDGIGMSETDLERVIEPFYSTKESGHGNGLGLSMVYGFAKQSDGVLKLASSIGKGTTATIWLPICTQQDDSVGSGEKQRVAQAKANKRADRALVVEDTDAVRDITAHIFEKLGFDVDAVRSADEARRVIESGLSPALLFTDLAMPGNWDGLDLAKWVQQHMPDTAVLIASGYASEDSNVDDFSFIAKPFSPAELEAAISQCVAKTASSES